MANFLTTQFYSEDYSIAQRTDMLEAISRAAMQLSRRQPTAAASEAVAKAAVSNSAQAADGAHGDPARSIAQQREEVVRARLEARTRRFHRARPQTYSEVAANDFTPVAGLFFFPLLNGHDQSLRTFRPMVIQGGDVSHRKG